MSAQELTEQANFNIALHSASENRSGSGRKAGMKLKWSGLGS
jgi:hypothetical protein